MSKILSFISVYLLEYLAWQKEKEKCKLHDRELIKRKLQKSIFLPL